MIKLVAKIFDLIICRSEFNNELARLRNELNRQMVLNARMGEQLSDKNQELHAMRVKMFEERRGESGEK